MNAFLRQTLPMQLGLAGLGSGLVNVGLMMGLGDIWIVSQSFGAVYGIAVATVLHLNGRSDRRQALATVAVFAASWLAALHAALWLHDLLTQSMFLLGVIGGLIGSAILLGGLVPVFGLRPGSSGIWTMLAAGALAGLWLGVSIPLLLASWQLVTGAVLGWIWPAAARR
jgi:hypothetical protein